MYKLVFALSILAILLAIYFRSTSQEEHLFIHCKNIWTGNAKQIWINAFLIYKNKIIKVGNESQIQEYLNSNNIKNVKNIHYDDSKMIVPGFIDSHLRIIWGGQYLNSIQLENAKTKDEFIEIVKEYLKSHPTKKGEWIHGGGYNLKRTSNDNPHKSWLDPLTPDNPIILRQNDGHSVLVNSFVLKMANITRDTKDVEGGVIERDENGEPTGVFKDAAISTFIEPLIPPFNDEHSLETAMEHLVSQGITSVHHMGAIGRKGGSLYEYKIFKKFRDEKKLKIRIYTVFELKNVEMLKRIIQEDGNGDDWLRIGILKEFFDGSLGSFTAYQFDAYLTNNNSFGMLVNDEQYMFDKILEADKEGFQVAVHAIGERANHILIGILEKINEKYPNKERRFRIEHVQQIRKEDIARLKKLDIIASVQPSHILDDAMYAEKLIGKKGCENLYSFKSLLDENVKLAFGTDWIVAPANPLLTIDAAVNRIADSHPKGFYPKERITIQQALEAYTIGASYAGKTEHVIGMIHDGYLADFLVLNKNLFHLSKDERIKDVQVEETWIDGKRVYKI